MLLGKGLKFMVTMYSRACVALEQAKDALELLAATITDWEESSRYGKGIRTVVYRQCKGCIIFIRI